MAKETCANPLLQQWVKEWMDKAEKINTKAYYTYKKVIVQRSLASTCNFDLNADSLFIVGL